jgi:hypothetical protein
MGVMQLPIQERDKIKDHGHEVEKMTPFHENFCLMLVSAKSATIDRWEETRTTRCRCFGTQSSMQGAGGQNVL